ncbi:MAG: CPBP family intramembrane glutamic endopeptidase [Candidatus Omnitrophota bacterium]
MIRLVVWCIAAACFWFLLFSPWTAELFPFWSVMITATGVLTFVAFQEQKREKAFSGLWGFEQKHIWIGIVSAIFLYAVFWTGSKLLAVFMPGSSSAVSAVYVNKAGLPAWGLFAMLFFWIGPAEEIFWRGYVQQRLVARYGLFAGWLAAAGIYAAVHVWSFNPVLILAALVCGLYWGLLFLVCRNLWPVIISHALWDVLIFVWFPVV